MKKLILALLFFTNGIFALKEIEPVNPELLKSNYVCLQRTSICACCEEFFGDCRRETLFTFEGFYWELQIFLREVREMKDEEDLTIQNQNSGQTHQ